VVAPHGAAQGDVLEEAGPLDVAAECGARGHRVTRR
jgi:hypothetical protein